MGLFDSLFDSSSKYDPTSIWEDLAKELGVKLYRDYLDAWKIRFNYKGWIMLIENTLYVPRSPYNHMKTRIRVPFYSSLPDITFSISSQINSWHRELNIKHEIISNNDFFNQHVLVTCSSSEFAEKLIEQESFRTDILKIKSYCSKFRFEVLPNEASYWVDDENLQYLLNFQVDDFISDYTTLKTCVSAFQHFIDIHENMYPSVGS